LKGGSIELEQTGSADAPLTVHGLYGGIIVNIFAVVQGTYAARLGPLAVATPALQFVTGLYLFVLPYALKWCSARPTG